MIRWGINERSMMSTPLRISLVAACALAATGAFGSPRCTVSMTNWQPRESLVAKLRSVGWTILRIKTDDGCYKVYATDKDGRRVEAMFDPGSLERVGNESRGR